MIKRLLILLTIVAVSLCVKAQSQLPTLKVLSITANGFNNFPDTIYGNQIYGYQIVVQNLDTSLTYTDSAGPTFSIMLQSDSIFFPISIYDDSSGGFSIAPGDTEVFNAVDTFNPAGFKLGNNVVVVWPSKAGGSQSFYVDSTYDSIYFTYATGIDELNEPGYSIYPNPFSDFLKTNAGEDSRMRLFIYDSAGRLVYENNANKQSPDLSFLNQGQYFVILRKNNLVKASCKMLKL